MLNFSKTAPISTIVALMRRASQHQSIRNHRNHSPDLWGPKNVTILQPPSPSRHALRKDQERKSRRSTSPNLTRRGAPPSPRYWRGTKGGGHHLRGGNRGAQTGGSGKTKRSQIVPADARLFEIHHREIITRRRSNRPRRSRGRLCVAHSPRGSRPARGLQSLRFSSSPDSQPPRDCSWSRSKCIGAQRCRC